MTSKARAGLAPAGAVLLAALVAWAWPRSFFGGPGPADDWERQARAGLLAEEPALALKALERAIAEGLAPERARELRAALAAESGQFEGAEPILRRAVKSREGDRPELWRALARTELARFRLGPARSAIARWAELAPNDPVPWLWLADVERRSRAEDATIEECYREALKRRPGSPAGALGLAEHLLAAHRAAEAQRAFADYRGLRPEDPRGASGAGRAAHQLGDLAKARGLLVEALAKAPDDVEALRALGEVEATEGRHSEALALWGRALAIDDLDQRAHRARARSLAALGDREGARSASERAESLRKDEEELTALGALVSASPNDAAPRARVVRWLVEHGRTKEALTWADEALRLAPDDPLTHQLLAGLFERQGDLGRANYHRLRGGKP